MTPHQQLPLLRSTTKLRVLSAGYRRGLTFVLTSLVLLGAVDAEAQRRKGARTTPPRPSAAAPAAPTTTTPTAGATNEDPPGQAPELPSTMDKIAAAADLPYQPKPGAHLVKFNLQDADLAELVNHISGMTGKRFIYGAKVRKIEATVVSPEPVTLDEAYQAFLSILQVNGMTVVPHGRFLKIVDSAGVAANGSPINARGAPIPNTDSYITRIYRTRYVGADEAMTLLTKFKSKEGDIATHPSGNLLIITDTGAQVRRMVRILEEVDVGGAGQQMWLEPVNHGNAADMAQRINDLFEVGEGSAGGLSKVIADDQTNSLIVVGTDDSYTKLLQVMKRLDTRAGEAGTVHVLRLQHAVADELSKTLQQMLSGAGGTGGRGGSAPAGAATVSMFDGEIVVTPDVATNSLVVSSSPRDFAQLRLVVERLDQPRRQVFIETVVMDVAISENNDLGFSWHGGGVQQTGDGTSTILTGFNGGRSMAFPLDTNSLTGFAAGIRGPDLPGTNNPLLPGVSIPAFGVVMNALAASGRTNLLASPHIIATDNVPAEIKVGENIPLQTNIGGGVGGLAGAAGGLGSGLPLAGLVGVQTPREDVGNKIKVTPHINESDQVRLEIEQESSAGKAGEGELGAVTITKRTAKTTVVVKDQQTVVIGGLTRDEFVTSKTKVPILGDIPVLGLLFSSTSSKKIKTNLLLVLTPHVIREQDDLRRIFERKMQERQEFIDRYFVFAPDNWKAPLDYTRLNGVVEDIRQAYFAVDARKRLEDELKPRDLHEHVPGDPVDLPSDLRADAGGAEPGGAPGAPAPARRKAPRRPQRKPPAPAPAAAPTPPPAPTGELTGDDPQPTAEFESSDAPSLRVAPPLRSVMNNETAE